MLKRVSILLLSLISVFQYASAKAPSGYYSSLKGKSTEALKTALYQIINPHTEVSSYNALPSYFQQTDLYPNSQRWWDMYSSIPIYLPWSGQKLNREHCLPKSWWGGNTSTPAYVDLFHLYPAEAAANQAKSNWPLGVVTGTPSFDNGFVLVGKGVNSGGADKVFEPNNEYKGDFARTYFYMVTCYQNMDWVKTWQVRNGTYPSLQDWAINLLLQWHRQDPVSQKEIDRNEAVYKIQNNRNPFIDDPNLAEYIWGNKKGQSYTPESTDIPAGDATLITPVNGMYLDFNQVALGKSITAQLIFKGENLSGDFELSIGGVNRSLFTLPNGKQTGYYLAAAPANTVSGTAVTITYTPNAIGSHNATVTVSEGGLPLGSVIKIFLRGECLEAPVLTQPTATEPTEVTDKSYVAHWEAPAGEVIDYYIVTVKRYKGGSVSTLEFPAETDSLLIDGLEEGDYDTYAVQSVRLETRSPLSNFVTVRPVAGIDDIMADEPLSIETHDGFIRFRCNEPHSNVRVFDLAGRLTVMLDQVTDGTELQLPAGIHFIVTDLHRRPIKIVSR